MIVSQNKNNYDAPLKVLIVEDEQIQYLSLKKQLNSYFDEAGAKSDITIADSSESATALLRSNKYDVGFFDLYLNDNFEGLNLLKNFREQVTYPIVLTTVDDSETVGRAADLGCEDYLPKPLKKEAIKNFMARFHTKINREEINKLILGQYITDDPQTIEQLLSIPNLRGNDNPIYLGGPTGTGKQVTAQIIHQIVKGGEGQFIEINCSSLVGDLAESELFGHEEGAFTGASKRKQGLFELANKGTIFLDEIGKMPLALQDKLLKVIEQKKFIRVGGTREIKSDFLLVSASCEDLQDLVDKGLFRQDLMERLKATSIKLKALNKRKNDVKKLLNHFIKNHSSGRLLAITESAMKFLENYLWPGNIRELKHLVDKWQANGMIRIDRSDLKDLEEREFKQKYTFLNDSIISYIQENGIADINEQILAEIVGYFYEKNGRNTMQTIEKLKTNNRRFYKSRELFESHLTSKMGGDSNDR